MINENDSRGMGGEGHDKLNCRSWETAANGAAKGRRLF